MDQETLLIFPQRGVQRVIGICKGVSTIRKMKRVLAELYRQQEKDERQTTIGNQIVQRMTINVGVRNLGEVRDSIFVRPRHEMVQQRKIEANWQKKKRRLLK